MVATAVFTCIAPPPLIIIIPLTLGVMGMATLIMRAIPHGPENACQRCGYDLHGNPDAGCPECGWGREEHKRRNGERGNEETEG